MIFQTADILAVLDQCCRSFSFPMLDNGYVYLAGTRLALFRSKADWAMVIEVFGFSPRAGLPYTYIDTFASRLHDRGKPENDVAREARQRYLANHPNDETRHIAPISEGPWQNAEELTYVADDATAVLVRDKSIPLPALAAYRRFGVELEEPPRVQVFELCRFLAGITRERVLATPQEQRISVLPEMKPLLQLGEWHHPNVVDDELPSESETFQQLAEVLTTGDVGAYRPTQPPNTHWRNWPGGGRL